MQVAFVHGALVRDGQWWWEPTASLLRERTCIAEASSPPAVAGLRYVSAYLPGVGLSQGAIMSSETDPVTIADGGDGTVRVSGYDSTTFGDCGGAADRTPPVHLSA